MECTLWSSCRMHSRYGDDTSLLSVVIGCGHFGEGFKTYLLLTISVFLWLAGLGYLMSHFRRYRSILALPSATPHVPCPSRLFTNVKSLPPPRF